MSSQNSQNVMVEEKQLDLACYVCNRTNQSIVKDGMFKCENAECDRQFQSFCGNCFDFCDNCPNCDDGPIIQL